MRHGLQIVLLFYRNKSIKVGATPTIPNHITIKEMTNDGGFYKTEQQYS